jgi:hypothetical protein
LARGQHACTTSSLISVRNAEPDESRDQWLGINRRNTEAIVAMPENGNSQARHLEAG